MRTVANVRSLWDTLKARVHNSFKQEPESLPYFKFVEAKHTTTLVEVLGMTEGRDLHVKVWGREFLIQLALHHKIEHAYYTFCWNWDLDLFKPTPGVVWFELTWRPPYGAEHRWFYDVWFRYVKPRVEANEAPQ